MPFENSVLRALSLDEKADLLAGAGMWSTLEVAHAGIPAVNVADGPNGLRSNESEPTTVFPVGVAMAATWNPELVREAAAAMGREARAKGVHVLLGPSVNIQRTPLGGRNFETYSEDPLLAAELAVAFVDGVQSEGVGASLKHFAANNQEHERLRMSANVDERTLREIYLPAFEAVVRRARPWTVMAAYNRVNGTYASEHAWLLNQVLREEWGFDGVVVSDWGAVHSSRSVEAGLDLEMPGPARFMGEALADAVRRGEVAEEAVDRAVSRILRLAARAHEAQGTAELNSDRHREIARAVAEEAIVLLRNEDEVLPLDPDRLKTLAVIGPNADEAIIQGGGSAHAIPFHERTPLDALKALLGDSVDILHAPGVDNEPLVPLIDGRLLHLRKTGGGGGLHASYFASQDWTAPAVKTATESYLHKFGFPAEATACAGGAFSARWEGWLMPDRTGEHQFAVEHAAKAGTEAEVRLDGEVIAGPDGPRESFRFVDVIRMTRALGTAHLEAGRAYRLEIRYRTARSLELFKVGMRKPVGSMRDAVDAARGADAALVFVGVSRSTDTEGYDRPDMSLWGDQDALVEAVAEANPNTIVVLQNGGPMAMPWLDRVKAVLTAWLPGQEGSDAIARVLTGAVVPSGKLPHTVPARLEDNPTYIHYPGTRDAEYGEGVFVGYRYYDKKRIQPLFPFGFGLSYSRFGYADLACASTLGRDGAIVVDADVTNLGARPAAETVQLYVEPLSPSEARPLRELKGFRKILLQPGETRSVRFVLSERDFAYYDVHEGGWRAEPGRYAIHVGGSSRDLPLRREIVIEG